MPVYRSSRDTRNAPLWNPSSQELLSIEDDEAGRLAGFRARFGKSFDSGTSTGAGVDTTARTTEEPDKLASEKKAEKTPKKTSQQQESSKDDLEGMFGEDDEELLQMISNFGKADKGSAAQLARKKI